jgi:hypothetical protein
MDEKRLAETRDYLTTWLDRSRQVADAASEVRRLRDLLDWELQTYQARPPEAVSVPTASLDKHVQLVNQRITSSLPMIPLIPMGGVIQVSSITASSSSAFVTYVADVGRLQTPSAVNFASKALAAYGALQESQQRPLQVRALLTERMPSVVAKFDSARDAYDSCKSGIGDRTAAAMEMRTFLDGVKGELFDRARGHAGENMTLELAAQRLFLSSPTRVDAEEQINQRSSLMEALSAVAKRRDRPGSYEIDALWVRTLDHAYVVLGALK